MYASLRCHSAGGSDSHSASSLQLGARVLEEVVQLEEVLQLRLLPDVLRGARHAQADVLGTIQKLSGHLF